MKWSPHQISLATLVRALATYKAARKEDRAEEP
jgi:hypothetical protein